MGYFADIERQYEEKQMTPNISALIVNFNNCVALERCVLSLLHQEDINLEVIVIDNCSTDGSSQIMKKYERRIKWIQLERNVGFGSAINAGAKIASGNFFAILNNDLEFCPRSLRKLVDQLILNPDLSCVVPKLVFENGLTQKSCRELPYLGAELAELFGVSRILPEKYGNYFLTKWNHESSRLVEQAAGACLVMSARVFREVGGFDTRYPLYFEDVDLCRKISNLGGIYYNHEVKVVHSGESTARKYRVKTTIAIAIGRYRYYFYTHKRIISELVRVIGIFRCLSRGFLLLLLSLHNKDNLQKSKGYFIAIGKLMHSPLTYNPLI